MKKEENIVVIDADSLVYIVGHQLKGTFREPWGRAKLNNYIIGILSKTSSPNYIGFFGVKGSRNFRYDIAVTKPYKEMRHARKKADRERRVELEKAGKYVEEDWFEFWEPVLKKHMEIFWKFQPVDTIEADDAVIIAKRKYEGLFSKVIIASTDKDLKQEPGWNYDYKAVELVKIGEQEAKKALASQLISGDSADSIPGLPGAGPGVATKLLKNFSYKNEEQFIKHMTSIYIEYFTKTLFEKAYVKQEKEFFLNHKEKYSIKSLTKKMKDIIRPDFVFVPDLSMTKEHALKYFDEMYALLRMLTTEEEGKAYDFEVGKTHASTKINLTEAIEFIDYSTLS